MPTRVGKARYRLRRAQRIPESAAGREKPTPWDGRLQQMAWAAGYRPRDLRLVSRLQRRRNRAMLER